MGAHNVIFHIVKIVKIKNDSTRDDGTIVLSHLNGVDGLVLTLNLNVEFWGIFWCSVLSIPVSVLNVDDCLGVGFVGIDVTNT